MDFQCETVQHLLAVTASSVDYILDFPWFTSIHCQEWLPRNGQYEFDTYQLRRGTVLRYRVRDPKISGYSQIPLVVNG